MTRAGVAVPARRAEHADAALVQPPAAVIRRLAGDQGGKTAVARRLLARREDEQPGLERRGNRDAGRAVRIEANQVPPALRGGGEQRKAGGELARRGLMPAVPRLTLAERIMAERIAGGRAVTMRRGERERGGELGDFRSDRQIGVHGWFLRVRGSVSLVNGRRRQGSRGGGGPRGEQCGWLTPDQQQQQHEGRQQQRARHAATTTSSGVRASRSTRAGMRTRTPQLRCVVKSGGGNPLGQADPGQRRAHRALRGALARPRGGAEGAQAVDGRAFAVEDDGRALPMTMLPARRPPATGGRVILKDDVRVRLGDGVQGERQVGRAVLRRRYREARRGGRPR